MKATFDVQVKIDGAKVETIFSMRDGVENKDVEIIDKVTKAATNFACTLKRRICREPFRPRKLSKICTNLRFCAENMQFFDQVSREIVNIRLFFLQDSHFGEKIASLHRNS